MAGISDSGHPDDLHIHLEQILSADAARAAEIEGESQLERTARLSVRLPQGLRQRAVASLEAIVTAVPGFSDVEAKKLLTSRAGRDALEKGKQALGRVDDHLRSATGQRNPQIGRSYGVYGRNPVSFGGVYRALGQCATENERLKALTETAPERVRLFTPYIELQINEAHTEIKNVCGARYASRAELSQQVVLRDEIASEAVAVIGLVRSHLYANLPLGKRDPDLREYGFRPIHTGRRSSSAAPEVEEVEAEEV